jgi:hypothetical protein
LRKRRSKHHTQGRTRAAIAHTVWEDDPQSLDHGSETTSFNDDTFSREQLNADSVSGNDIKAQRATIIAQTAWHHAPNSARGDVDTIFFSDIAFLASIRMQYDVRRPVHLATRPSGRQDVHNIDETGRCSILRGKQLP